MTPWPFRHIGLKLLSVALAVLLWMVVAGEETVERGLSVPLELQQFPASLELETKPPSTVDVRVRGDSGALSRLTPVDIVAVLDLRGARIGQRLFHLTPEQVRVPFGVEVVQVTPATIALTFENSLTKQVKVLPGAIDGTPAPGFVVGKIAADPPVVDIVGPESAVKRAAAALTEPISVAGARDRVRQTVNVGVLDPALRLKTMRSAVIEVEIVPAPAERPFRNLPVHWRNLPPHLVAQFTPSTVDVTVRGTREAVNRLAADGVTAYVELAGVGTGQYPVAVHAEAAAGAGVTRIEPAMVEVRIISAKN